MRMKRTGKSITAVLLVATFMVSIVYQPALAVNYQPSKTLQLSSLNINNYAVDSIIQGAIAKADNKDKQTVAGANTQEASQQSTSRNQANESINNKKDETAALSNSQEVSTLDPALEAGMPNNGKTMRFIVKYKKSKEKVNFDPAAKLKSDVKEVRKPKDSRMDIIFTNDAMKPEDLLNKFKQKNGDQEIEYIQPDYQLTTSSEDTVTEATTTQSQDIQSADSSSEDTSGSTKESIESGDNNLNSQDSSTEIQEEQDITAPEIQEITADGDKLTLTYSEELNQESIPSASDFRLKENGSPSGKSITDVVISTKKVILTLSESLSHEDILRLSYTPGSSPIIDSANNVAAALEDEEVENTTSEAELDNTAPALQELAIKADTLILTYDEDLNQAIVPAASDFTVTINAGSETNRNAAIKGVKISGKTVVLSLEESVTKQDVVTLSYIPGSNPLQDTNANTAPEITGQAVTNNTVELEDTTAPVLQSAQIKGNVITLTYDENLNEKIIADVKDFTVILNPNTKNESEASISKITISQKTVTITMENEAAAEDIVKISYTPGEDVNALKDLAGNAAAAFSDQKISLLSDTVANDPFIDQQWGLYQEEQTDAKTQQSVGYRIDANVADAWKTSKGEGVIVAVLDTGIDITHEDLKNNIWVNTAEIPGNGIDDDGNGYIDDVNGWNFVDETNTVHDANRTYDEWHGTHIAGIIAAEQGNEKGISGVAPKATIMPLQVFKNGTAYTSDIIDAINYAKAMGVKVVNCSWGTTSENQALQEAMDESGMLFVCAAGNSSANIDTNPVYPASLTGDEIITVASINKTGHLSHFSNYGQVSVDVAAPGEEILSTTPGNSYGPSGGTSQAAAFVSGEAALIAALYPELTPTEIKNRIIASADKLSSLSEKTYQSGKVNCANAVADPIISNETVIAIPAEEAVQSDDTGTSGTGEYSLFSVDKWVTKPSMQYNRSALGVAVVNDKIYAIGGTTGYRTPDIDVEEYDPATYTWTTKASLNYARCGLGAAAVNGKIYAIGGYNGNNFLSTVEEYNPSTNTWTTKTSMPTARSSFGIAVLNGKIYVIGGCIGYWLYGVISTNIVEVYDPANDSWSTQASMPTARADFCAATLNGKIYAVGGFSDIYIYSLNTVEVFDPATNTWASCAGTLTARQGSGISVANGKIYVFDGEQYCDGYGYLYVGNEEYNPNTDSWSSKTSTTARTDVGVALLKDQFYVIGGYAPYSVKRSQYLSLVEATNTSETDLVHLGQTETNLSGNFSRTYTDMQFDTPGFNIAISRTYNSRDDRTTSLLSNGWTFGFQGKVDIEGCYRIVRLPNGSAMTFLANNNGTYTAQDSRSTFAIQSDSTYILTTKDQYTYGFNTSRWLNWMKDRNGNIINIAVNASDGKITAITDQAGRQITITYNSLGFIDTITDPFGRTVQYQYENSHLVRAIDPMGKITRYTYNTAGYVSEIRDNDNKLIEAVTYDTSAGTGPYFIRISTLTDASGNVSTYVYDQFDREMTVTDSNSRQTITWYDSSFYPIKIQDPDGKISTTAYSLNSSSVNLYGEESSVADRNGNTTAFNRDSNGNIIKIINPDLSYKEFTYDSKNNKTSEKDENGKYTFYIYDTDSINLIKKAQPLNGTDQYTTGCNENNFAITTYTYYTGTNVKGLLHTETDPRGKTTTYTYDSYGNIATVTDPSNHVKTYSYNNIGWKTSELSPKQYQTSYVYDKNGLIEKSILNGGETTRTTYDNMNRKTKVVSANQYNAALDGLNLSTPTHTYSGDQGTRYTYYDNGLVHTETDPQNNTTSYTYDIYGNKLTETKPNGAVYVYSYDVMNRLSTESFKENSSASAVLLASYTYLLLTNGNTKVTKTEYLNDTEQAVTSLTYDYAGRLIRQDNPDLTYTITSYNPNGTVAYTIDEKENTTYFQYDGLNRLTVQLTPVESVNGTIKYMYAGKVYDKAGNVTEEKVGKTTVGINEIPGSFISTFYEYYDDGKLHIKTDSAGRKTEYQYDAEGFVTKEDVYTDTTNKITTEYINNYFGKPTQKILHVRQGDLYGQDYNSNQDTLLTTLYTYDFNGNLKTETRPDQIVITYGYDNLNRQTSISQPGQDENGTAVTITTSKTYNWNGDVLTETDENNHTTTYTYNQQGLLTSVTDAKGNIAASYYDRAGRLIGEVSPKNYDSSKTFSAMNRTEYTYDLMDRVKTKSYTYLDPVSGQWVSYVAKAYKYDANGNIIKELDALGYDAGTGTTADAKINSGYGTEYSYDLNDKQVSILDPVNKDAGLTYTTKYEYDGAGRKIKETNAKGNITAYTYDDAGNLLNTAVNNQIIGANTYDLAGNKLTQTDGNGNTTSFEYNAFGQMKKATMPGDTTIPVCTITYQYNVLGNLRKQTSSAGTVDLFTYDNQGRELSQTQQKADGTQVITTAIRYDKAGNKRYVTDGNSVTTTNIYNEINQLVSSQITTTNINGITTNHLTQYGYDANGNQTTQTDWRGNISINIYDPINRLIQKIDPLNVTTQKLSYNHNNVQVNSYDALNKLTQYTYDKDNRLLSTIDPLLHTTSQTYDTVGNIKTKTDGRSKVTTLGYDQFNRLISVLNAKNETTGYSYDLAGNLLTQTDGKGNVTTYEYNAANKAIRKINNGGRSGTAGNYTYVSSLVESYTYYADGNLATKIDRNGNTTTYTYDAHGRLLNQTVGSITNSYTYDGNGNQLTMTDSTGTTTRTYDELNRVKTKAVPNIGTVSFLYDDIAGLPTGYVAETATDPKGNTTKKVFDKADRMVNVIAGGLTTTYTYYNNGSKHTVVYPGGAGSEYTYYDDNLLFTLVNKKADQTVISSYTYTYDAAHNQTTKVDSKGTTSYTYDDLNRLQTVTEPSGNIITYTFDAAGNRTTKTQTSGGTITYAYNNLNRLDTVTDSSNNTITYTFDAAGNGTQGTITSTYDVLNRMTSATCAGVSTTYSYNAEGFRVGKVAGSQVTNYLWEANQIVLETDNANNQTARNVWGTTLISRTVNGETLYYMYNGHGDVTSLVDANGVIRATYDYDSFGNLTEEKYYDASGTATTTKLNNPIRYAGYQYDEETGYYYLIARYYDPITGRFTSEDTYMGEKEDPLSLNLYTYCQNEPIMYTDPNGHAMFQAYKTKIKPQKQQPKKKPAPTNNSTAQPIPSNNNTKANSSQKPTNVVKNDPGTKVTVKLANGQVATGIIKDGNTVMSNGSRPPEGAVVHTAGGDYKVENGKGVQVNVNISSSHPSLVKSGASLGVSFIPIVGDVKDVQETLTGVDLITGEKLSTADRVITGVCIVVPEVSGKAIREGVDLATEGVDKAVDIELKYKEGWTVAQKAEADAKVKALTEADTVKTAPNRSGTSASSRYKKSNGANSAPSGKDVDHTIDLQLGGAEDILNMNPLDASVNRSLGKQIQNTIKDYPIGTRFGGFTIK